MVRWIDALARTRRNIAASISKVLGRAGDESIEDLAQTLITADVPARLATEWVEELRNACRGLRVSPRELLPEMLIKALGEIPPFSWERVEKPLVLLVVGINGSGKTTTCAKLACQARQAGRKPILGATDTFRAAGGEQLKIWAERVGCAVVAGAPGADAAAVAYDALDAAIARGLDVVIIDTAGRMHTKRPLMDELQKVRRALDKRLPGAPHETWAVLDATAGHNAVVQARVFHEATPLTGAVVAKLDGSSKAGFVFAVRQELDVPIRMVGLGEGLEDLVPFDAQEFVDGLLGRVS